MLSQNLMEKILDYAVSHGADFAEIFCEDVRRSNLTVLGEKILNSSSGREKGVGIRLFKGLESAYLYTSDLSEAEIFRLLEETCRYRDGSFERAALEAMRRVSLNPISRYPQSISLKDKMALANRVVSAGKKADETVSQVRVNYVDMDQKVWIANSEGLFVEDNRVKTRLHMTVFCEEGGDRQSSYVGPGAMKGFEFYDEINVEDYVKQAAKKAKAMLHAKACPTGRMPVIITNGFGGLFFHEACGHSLEASGVAKGNSEFSGKLGQKVASDKLTLIDDGSIPGQWGSLKVDDEGVPTQKNVLIENGILKGYMVDKLNARRMGCAPTGSSRRQSFRFAPTSRMTNTYIAPGESTPEEMIAATERGIFVNSINAGSVNPATGEFNFNTSETFLIENGKITTPVRSATLIGTGGDILQKVDMVGNDYALGQGFCYAASGALYIGAGQPTVRVTEMTVGGDQGMVASEKTALRKLTEKLKQEGFADIRFYIAKTRKFGLNVLDGEKEKSVRSSESVYFVEAGKDEKRCCTFFNQLDCAEDVVEQMQVSAMASEEDYHPIPAFEKELSYTGEFASLDEREAAETLVKAEQVLRKESKIDSVSDCSCHQYDEEIILMDDNGTTLTDCGHRFGFVGRSFPRRWRHRDRLGRTQCTEPRCN